MIRFKNTLPLLAVILVVIFCLPVFASTEAPEAEESGLLAFLTANIETIIILVVCGGGWLRERLKGTAVEGALDFAIRKVEEVDAKAVKRAVQSDEVKLAARTFKALHASINKARKRK